MLRIKHYSRGRTFKTPKPERNKIFHLRDRPYVRFKAFKIQKLIRIIPMKILIRYMNANSQ